MTTMIRRNARRGAVVLGSLAVVLGAAACGGSSDDAAAPEEKTTEAASAAEEAGDDAAAAEDSASDEGGAASEDAGDDAASGPLSDEDLTAASQAFVDFLTAAVEGDSEKACGLIKDPTTGDAFASNNLETCKSQFGSMTKAYEGQDSSLFTTETVTAADNGDGTAAISFNGQDMGISMSKGSAGTWLVDTSTATS
ncbi:hypothetical protein GCM10009592_23030 [Brachybacterium rhamnosum]|uniref:DUF4878 domain-containing protein n=1 Tax=Brachybacterium rhamnosum TaxID=173361 RepID=A0ABW4PYF4_9MICO